MSLKMAWIANAWNFVMKLEQSINDPYSTLWKEVESAIQKIERDTNISTYLTLSTNDVNEIMLQQKAKWITSETTIEQILKFLIFYGNHSITSNILNIKLINERDITAYAGTICYQLIHCCQIFETIHLYEQYAPPLPTINLALRIEFCDQQNYENILWRAIFKKHMEQSESNILLYQAIIGFVLVFGKEHIGQLLSNTSESELQNKMMSCVSSLTCVGYCDKNFSTTAAIKWSKILKKWSNNVEMYGKKLILEQIQKKVERHLMSAE
eukprot:223941_1